MFSLSSDLMNKTQLIHSVANKTLGKKSQDANLIKWEQLWLRQVMWKKVAQDPRWDSSHPIPWGEPLGETQWSLWVPSDSAELASYAGYSMSYSTWEVKFSCLFTEITTHHFISVICTMKWLVVQRQKFHPAAKRWQFQEDKGAAIPSSAVREGWDKQWGWTPTRPGVLTSGQIVVLLVLNWG